MLKEEWEDAIKNFDITLKHTVALQPIYWKARRQKAICHMALKQWDKAAFDLKLFTKRKFEQGNPNLEWRRQAFYNYGKVLIELERYDDALSALDAAAVLDEHLSVSQAELLRFRGIAKKEIGKNGFVKDLKDAADLGDKIAKSLLKEMQKPKVK